MLIVSLYRVLKCLIGISFFFSFFMVSGSWLGDFVCTCTELYKKKNILNVNCVIEKLIYKMGVGGGSKIYPWLSLS